MGYTCVYVRVGVFVFAYASWGSFPVVGHNRTTWLGKGFIFIIIISSLTSHQPYGYLALLPRAALFPLAPPNPLPMLDPLRALCKLDTLLSAAKLELLLVLPPRPMPEPLVNPLPRDRVPRAPRVVVDVVVVGACLCRSASSAFRRASSRLLSASAARLSASCCLRRFSLSISSRSCVAPLQFGFRISRWLCSVCDRMRVHVLSRVLALVTVCDTVYRRGQEYTCQQKGYSSVPPPGALQHTLMFPFALSRVPRTPSMTSLMLRTPSSSLRSPASRASSASKGAF